MSYLTYKYLFGILPFLLIVYNLLPKGRKYFLLLANILFYLYIGKKLIIFLLLTILSVYLSGRLMNKYNGQSDELLKKYKDKKIVSAKIKKKRKIVLLLCILFNVGFLFAFKYLNFFTVNLNLLFEILHINTTIVAPKLLAPIGISFYTLTALSYVIDVYNNKIEASNNIVKVALFVSFFTQIIEGPFTRFSETADSLFEGKRTSYKSLCFGYERIIYGLFKKKVIADRANIVVDMIFNNYANYSGASVLMGVIGYVIVLYMEFSGTMDVVMGTGELFGVKLPENFRQPFFSKNISEFWTRWHISLGAWFRDYIYYPLSLSKPLKKLTIKARKVVGNHYGPLISGSIALFAVWFLNGLWHGAGYTFLFFGMYHFVLIVLGNFASPLIIKICEKLHINRENIVYRIIQSLKLTFLVIIGELFFRANTMTDAFAMFTRIFSKFNLKGTNFLGLGLDIYDYIVLFISLIFIFIIGLLKEKGVDVREKLDGKKTWAKWAILYIFILAIIIFGAYGPGYVPVDPIYADF